MRFTLVLLVLMALGGLAWVRLAPSDPGRWHVNPLTARDPGSPNFARIPPGEIVTAEDPATLAARIDAALLAMPRVTRLAGEPKGGFVTYIARSRLLGFPDYVTVRTLAADRGATFAALSRARFGASDFGVNAARMQALRDALE
ncbi:DUF1499 domain-containing protein [Frigidibacter albus]|uniref:DUF1499 domain-containing protein n=1 Tax=Frigidibacter albus TaxID=1465486 RepID=A0A6L8VCX2_9RHOB|nr:DUF1499 domain-containing protein [Frigidibacter albus]MZQ88157.1 DUF1499 domain-containing protein [Frigidibacter albus]NBE30169.1 DUF1499 domain-containing protein [Frigidibacter albus]GGH47134.1 hypothetical protein GCM10011341_08060 [Frigidibacter albus]